VADPRRRFQRRVLTATLRHGRARALLAAAAVGIGVSVAAALMHVSSDVGRKVAHELRALGPNLLVTPAGTEYLDVADARGRLRTAGLDGAALLYVVASARGEPLPVIGAEPEPAAALHPQWRISRVGAGAVAGVRLLDRLRLAPGSSLRIVLPGDRPRDVAIGARLEAGGADDEALWLPLADVQRATDLGGRASVMQARVEGGRDAAERVRAALERDGHLRVSVVGALTAAEADLLERLRRIMTLVTASALVAAGLCAFGALTDRALERRKDWALLKALGAEPGAIVTQFAAEALTIGLAGGVVGWAFGLLMAQVIGHQVFHASIAVRPDVPLVVIGLALLVAAASSIGPARLALSVEPAAALKGD
jgi:putative ABC transport system permease protein